MVPSTSFLNSGSSLRSMHPVRLHLQGITNDFGAAGFREFAINPNNNMSSMAKATALSSSTSFNASS